MARPGIKISQQTLAGIASMLFDGFEIRDIAFFHDVDVKTVSKISLGDEFPAVRKSVLKKKQIYIAKLRDGKSKQWSRIAWFLERRWPKEFARPEIQLSLATGQITNNTLVVSTEMAEELVSRSKRLGKEIDALLTSKRQSSEASAGEQTLNSSVVSPSAPTASES